MRRNFFCKQSNILTERNNICDEHVVKVGVRMARERGEIQTRYKQSRQDSARAVVVIILQERKQAFFHQLEVNGVCIKVQQITDKQFLKDILTLF